MVPRYQCVNTYMLLNFWYRRKSCFIKRKHYKFASCEAKRLIVSFLLLDLPNNVSFCGRELSDTNNYSYCALHLRREALLAAIYNELVSELEPARSQDRRRCSHKDSRIYRSTIERNNTTIHILSSMNFYMSTCFNYAGNSVEVPATIIMHTRSDETRRVAPAKVLIVEGILLLSDPHFEKNLILRCSLIHR